MAVGVVQHLKVCGGFVFGDAQGVGVFVWVVDKGESSKLVFDLVVCGIVVKAKCLK